MASDDIFQITNVLNLYALGVDTQQWDLFDRVFAADVDSDYSNGMHWTDLASFKRDFAAIHDPLEATQHTITNHQIVLDGDRATSICYGHWRLIRHVAQGEGSTWEGGGWYDDSLVRTPAGWRIRKRVVGILWWSGNPFVTSHDGTVGSMAMASLRKDAPAGRIAYLNALTG